VTRPVVWLPEAHADLKEARAWYDDIRPELGERFAHVIEATIQAIRRKILAISYRIGDGGVLEYAASHMGSSLSCKRIGLS